MKVPLLVILVVGLLYASGAGANKVKTLSVTNPHGYDRAPELVVYSTTGERWTSTDTTTTATIGVNFRAECQWEGRGNKAYRGNISAPGLILVGQRQPANFMIPHADSASGLFRWDGGDGQNMDPVKVCNDELEKRVANEPGKTKYHFLADGFRVNTPATLRINYQLTCKPIGLGFADIRTRSAMVNTVVNCTPSPLAAAKVPSDKPKPARAAPPPPKRQAPLLKAASFEAEPEVHTADCPATIRFNGTMTANRAGRVTYEYVKHDGSRSPRYTMNFSEAGTLPTRAWQTVVAQPDPGKTLSAGNTPPSNDIQGWYRLDVLSPAPTGQIVAHYRVMCGADAEDSPATLQVNPVERQPAERKPEVRRLEQPPARVVRPPADD